MDLWHVDTMKKIYQTENPMQAHLFKLWLETQDISAIVTGNDITITDSCVWVADTLADEDIHALHKQFIGQQLIDCSNLWLCNGCGEYCEASLSVCWQCGQFNSH